MSYRKFAQEYLKGAVNGASPLQLIIMLYDGALRFMEAGRHAMLAGEIDKQNTSLQRAQHVVTELMACLDMEQGGEVATNLFALYSFALNQLVEANISDKTEAIDACIKIFSDLRESWVRLEADLRLKTKPGDALAA
ncbi:MAG: flagellar export chaperone FliS [Fimbriimonas ginsengisoli]|uniref:Flagellar secretion chaperone FliS n=1 Tax=Fimbriimonas ginsengisoli TaxID=1005039 RepID=A0A931PVW5_FIMGI|nr:flagellar export chaperone FliS [Fimbriimonas ginsengisoli]